jgi:oligoendopeptidase F
MRLFSRANVPLFAELSKLETEWSKLNGSMTVEWHGEEKTPAQLLPFLESNDRALREEAFRLRAQPAPSVGSRRGRPKPSAFETL